MEEKLVYRSHFQPAPRKKSGAAAKDDDILPSSIGSRRGSPYRSSSSSRSTKHILRTLLRVLVLLTLLLVVDRVTGWRRSQWYARWVCGRGVVRSTREWRGAYDEMELGLRGLPLSFKIGDKGDEIPSVGLGTWKASEKDVVGAVTAALEAGYRHIDGAWIYGNEVAVGEALQAMAHHVPRESLFITSKLWNTFHAPEDIEPTLDETLSMLQTSYIDLYLIHWPVAQVHNGKRQVIDWELTENPIKTWEKLEELVRKGKIRNLGVSNFNIRRLQNLTSSPSLTIRPVVNQVELNYWNPQPDLLAWSKGNNILLEAYSPLGGDGMVKKTLNLPIIRKIAKKLSITPAQVIISWHVQRGTVVLPKSIDPGRISENYQLFTLPPDLFQELEHAAVSHTPHRLSDPSARWGLDVFEDEKEEHEIVA